MNVLVFNCGSSSLKYRLIDLPSQKELAGGEAQRVGPPTAEPARILHNCGGGKQTVFVDMPSHAAALEQVLAILSGQGDLAVHAMGHRLVHGGSVFAGPVVIDAAVLRRLHEVADLAPLHNIPAIALVEACLDRHPDVPQVAVFDTAYHATIPEYARTYALPAELVRQTGIRKYGFHGTSHRYVVREAAKMLGKPIARFSGVSCHLGSGGASLCAVVNGKSVDNTMGYSPLQGLVMSTRCGDLDPAVTMRLLQGTLGDGRAVEKLLNTRSGVLGLSGTSADIRDVINESSGGELESPTAQVYLWRIRKYLGAYLAAVGRAGAVIFTDTIGESMPQVRQVVCENMECFSLKIDPQKNVAAAELPADVAAADSAVRILVIRTNEELEIAREVWELLARTQPAGVRS